jgi:hypothetical protein
LVGFELSKTVVQLQTAMDQSIIHFFNNHNCCLAFFRKIPVKWSKTIRGVLPGMEIQTRVETHKRDKTATMLKDYTVILFFFAKMQGLLIYVRAIVPLK